MSRLCAKLDLGKNPMTGVVSTTVFTNVTGPPFRTNDDCNSPRITWQPFLINRKISFGSRTKKFDEKLFQCSSCSCRVSRIGADHDIDMILLHYHRYILCFIGHQTSGNSINIPSAYCQRGEIATFVSEVPSSDIMSMCWGLMCNRAAVCCQVLT